MSSKNNWQDKFLQKKLTKFVKVRVSRICLNQIRSNTYNQSIEKKKVTQNILVKNAFLVRLRISLSIFMRRAAERDNLMRLYGCSISYTWPHPLSILPSYLGIFRLDFENTIFIFEISILEFAWLQNFEPGWKSLNLRPKMPYLGIFGLEFKKGIIIFEVDTL